MPAVLDHWNHHHWLREHDSKESPRLRKVDPEEVSQLSGTRSEAGIEPCVGVPVPDRSEASLLVEESCLPGTLRPESFEHLVYRARSGNGFHQPADALLHHLHVALDGGPSLPGCAGDAKAARWFAASARE